MKLFNYIIFAFAATVLSSCGSGLCSFRGCSTAVVISNLPLGIIDSTFATSGVATLDVNPSHEQSYGMAVASDGKLLLGGTTSAGVYYDNLFVKYLSTGVLDTSIPGGTGYVQTDIGTYDDTILRVVAQPDDKLVAVGYTGTAATQLAFVERYNSNGTLDTGFNTTGVLTIDIAVGTDNLASVTLQPDGKIVAVGHTANGGANYDSAVVRLTAAGALDTTFNGTGKLVIANSGLVDYLTAVTIQSDGKILTAGIYDNGADYDWLLMRLDANGALDTTFNTTGKRIISYFGGAYETPNAIKQLSNGKIIVAGNTNNGSNNDAVIARFNSDGSTDTTFGTGGRIIINLGASESIADIAIQADGRILFTGYTSIGGTNDLLLGRVTAAGALDTTFADGVGYLVKPIGTGTDMTNSIVLLPDYSVVVSGYGRFGASDRIFVAKYR